MWAFGKVSSVINIWLVMQCMALLVFPMFSLWVNSRGMWYSLPDIAWIPIYLSFLVVFAVFPIQEVSQHELPTGSSLIVTAEQVNKLNVITSLCLCASQSVKPGTVHITSIPKIKYRIMYIVFTFWHVLYNMYYCCCMNHTAAHQNTIRFSTYYPFYTQK